ncbi:nuclear transport factor 2 family protein [Actinomycetospora cinnamomea]|uniref:SnoaL-like protein n=1 Tax=Actinomycetospora cinnamomea TaxID=663609 RepID=A0A2U1FIJ9_9PSEU|nr:nuclear transport factor 2 family protein [Actinomycetospora cinnamomea]PVZ12012.1 SnoaL-like protein [Actinomycetospora cinnamomea]
MGTAAGAVRGTTAADLEATVRGYMDACTAGDADTVAAHLAPEAVHYFPPDMYDGPWRGARTIAQRWATAVRERGSSWTVDAIVVDEPRRQAVCEWTHHKGSLGVILRGAEWYEFDGDGFITEIRAYYASPQAPDLARLELGGFDYAGRGYPHA